MSEKKYVLVFGESDLPGLKLAGPLRRRATVIKQPVLDIIEAVLDGEVDDYSISEVGEAEKHIHVDAYIRRDNPTPTEPCDTESSIVVNKCGEHSEQVHSAPCRSVDVQSNCTITPCPTCGGSGEVSAFVVNVSTGKKNQTGMMKCWSCFGSGEAP